MPWVRGYALKSKKQTLLIPFFLFCLLLLLTASRAYCLVRGIHCGEVFELLLSSQKQLANPYVESLTDDGTPYAQYIFTAQSGPAQGQRIAVRAFWDGGRNWRVRFAPPAPGMWSYESKSSDPSLNGHTGGLNCTDWTDEEKKANPTRHGLVRVATSGPRAGHTFAYADGTPFLWIGDTWWDWSKPGIKFESFKKLVDDRAAKGFSVGQLRFNSRTMLDRANINPGLEEIRRVEQMIAYANSRGITVWIMPWWGGENLKRVGPENVRRWWRYTMQRLGAYNVLWVLAGEYNMDDYSGLGLPFWQDLAAMIHREDPFGHLVSAHPTPPSWDKGFAAPQWSTAEVPAMQGVLDYNQSQVGHGKWANEMIPGIVSAAAAHTPAKPIVVTEPWYEFSKGIAPAEDIRFGAWTAVLSGAAGHSYGGGHVWWAHVPEAPSSQSPNWPLERGFETDTLDYPGAQAMGYMAHFLRATQWWNLEPHPELISDTPAKYCAAVPGREYVVYLRWGGMVNVDLRPSTPADPFDSVWLDPATGKQAGKGKTVSGGAMQRFNAPRSTPDPFQPKDWVLWVKRK